MEQPPKTNNHESTPLIEIEQKYLLASKDDAKRLEEKIKEIFPDAKFLGYHGEDSYYFPETTKDKTLKLVNKVVAYIKNGGLDLLAKIKNIPEDNPIQIRLRYRSNPFEESFTLTIKAGQNPLHDMERIEIDMGPFKNYGDLAHLFLGRFAEDDFKPLSRWFSNRRIYAIDDQTTIDVQDVTGYGWTAEIESNDPEKVRLIAEQLGLKPASKESLDVMYKQYGKNWKKYYNGRGVDRHFSEEDWKEIELAVKEGVIKNQVN